MPTTFETFIAEEYIYNKLTSDTTLTGLIANRVFADISAVQTFPFVIFANSTYEDVKGNGNVTAMAKLTYLVKVVGKTRSYSSLKSIVERVDYLLNHTKGVVPSGDGYVDACESTTIFKQAYTDANGVDYREIGKFYELLIQGV